MNEEKLEVLLDNGYKIVVERSTDPNFPREVYVGIEKDGMFIQDLVVVRNSYKILDNGCESVEYAPDKIDMLIYGDSNIEDYTEKVTVDIYKED